MKSRDPALRSLWKKVESQTRFSLEDAMTLYRSSDLAALGAMANMVRERLHGNKATYIFNRYINYSNICILNCQFCAFGAKKRDAHAFQLAIPQIVEVTAQAWKRGATEIHMVGGLHPSLPAAWYLELLREIRKISPTLHLKAFTAIEVRHLAFRIFKKPLRETLELLREAGLNTLTGGGAEIFDPVIRDRICRGKETAQEWLEVHQTWHEMGMRSNATMLFGHLETIEHRVDHLSRLRQLQDQTHGFTAFLPYAFVPETTALAHIPPAGEEECLRNLAVARLFLDNFDHITAYWISFGLPLAAQSLHYGVDDLHGTIEEEKIFHMAGATTPEEQTVESLEKAISSVGRTPFQRDTFYRIIQKSSLPTTG